MDKSPLNRLSSNAAYTLFTRDTAMKILFIHCSIDRYYVLIDGYRFMHSMRRVEVYISEIMMQPNSYFERWGLLAHRLEKRDLKDMLCLLSHLDTIPRA